MLRDRRIIFAASFLRAVANGLIGVLAGIYLAQLGLDPAAWGAVLGAGIAGTAVGAAGGMFWGDRVGRKRWLVAPGVLAAAGGLVFCRSAAARGARRRRLSRHAQFPGQGPRRRTCDRAGDPAFHRWRCRAHTRL